MIEIKFVTEEDRSFWFSLDSHLSEDEFEKKVRDKRGYVVLMDGKPMGLMRYNLFWDNTPFCTLLYIDEAARGKGLGRALMERWEHDMRGLGFGMLMTSTQVDESAQHFYRKLGYRDCGGFTVDIEGYEQPMELIMNKDIRR